MTVTNKRIVEILTTAMEKPEIANALIQRVINTLNKQPEREWQGLTDEDIRKLSDDCAGVRDETEFIRAIEEALRRKNT